MTLTKAQQQQTLTHKQKLAVARVSGAAKSALRAAFAQQNRGGDSHDAVARRRANRGRARPRMARPDTRAYGRAQFEANDAKALMMESWKATPASSNLMAPRGYGYYDAFATQPMSAMTHMSIGPATPIDAKTTCGGGGSGPAGLIETNAFSAELLIVQPTSDAVQAVLHKVSGAGSGLINTVSYRSPQLDADPPMETIPTRCSVRIGNYTSSINQGGIVRVLRMTTGVNLAPGYTTNDELLELMQGIREHKRTRQYKGCELNEDMQINCIVADQSRSLTFSNFAQPRSSDLVPWLATGSPPEPPSPATQVFPFTTQLYDPTFTPIAILFEPFLNVQPGTGGNIGNTYQVVVQSQFLAHYKQGSMLANLAISPSSDLNVLNKHRDKEEAKGSSLEKIWNGAQRVGRFAMNHRQELASVASLFL